MPSDPAVASGRGPTPRYLGQPIKRREDPRLVQGQGSYFDDVALPGLACLALARSPHGHARIRAIDARAARVLPGVLAVVTNAELADHYGPLPTDFGLDSY